MDMPTSLTAPAADARYAWRTAEADATLAYRAWCEAGSDERREAYSVFLAAADRAAAAADALSRLAPA